MPDPQESNPVNPDENLSVTEAAQRLGVSERTVYRMMKAGKLPSVSRGKTGPRTRTTLTQSRPLPPNQPVESLSKMSDNTTFTRLEKEIVGLREELKRKESQIGQLIQSNLETQVSLNKIQEQMIEMARLILSKSDLSQSPTTLTNVTKTYERQNSPWARFFPSRRADRNPDEPG